MGSQCESSKRCNYFALGNMEESYMLPNTLKTVGDTLVTVGVFVKS